MCPVSGRPLTPIYPYSLIKIEKQFGIVPALFSFMETKIEKTNPLSRLFPHLHTPFDKVLPKENVKLLAHESRLKLSQLEKRHSFTSDISFEINPPLKKSFGDRGGDFLKGLAWDGPKEMVSGLIQLSPFDNIARHVSQEWQEPGYHWNKLQSAEGRRELSKEQMRATPGVEAAEALATFVFRPIQTFNAAKEHCKTNWQSDEGKGKMAFDVVSSILPLLKWEKIGKLVQIRKLAFPDLTYLSLESKVSKIPSGFKNLEEFKEIGSQIYQTLEKNGFPDSQVHIRGSAVTGINWKTGNPFDFERRSDFDIAISSPQLLGKTQETGITLLNEHRTWPIKQTGQLKKLGLYELTQTLRQQTQRKISFVIYDSEQTITKRGPHLRFPKE